MPNPPRPLEQKRRLGNPGKRQLPNESKTVALEPANHPPPPSALGEPGVNLWIQLYDQATWLSTVDHLDVEELCHLKDEVDEMRRRIAAEGLTQLEPIVTPAGHVVGERMTPHPLLKELRSAQKLLQQLGSALGLDPTSRSRLGLAEVKKQSIIEQLLTSRNDENPVVEAQVIDIAADD